MCRLNVNCVVEKMEKFGVYVAILKLIGFSDYIFHKIEMKFRKFFVFVRVFVTDQLNIWRYRLCDANMRFDKSVGDVPRFSRARYPSLVSLS
jgi:hypothetical protein